MMSRSADVECASSGDIRERGALPRCVIIEAAYERSVMPRMRLFMMRC